MMQKALRLNPPGNRPISLLMLVAAAVVAAAAGGCDQTPPEEPPEKPSEPPAETTINTSAFVKEHDLAGKVAFIQFGTIRGRLSRQGLETMGQLVASGTMPELACMGVEMVADAKALEEYFGPIPPMFSVVPDPDGSAARGFRIRAHPTAVIIDTVGRVRYNGPFPTEGKLYDWYDALVAEKATPVEDPPIGLWSHTASRLLGETRLPNRKGEPVRLGDFVRPGGLLAVFVDTQCPFAGEAVDDVTQVVSGLAGHDVATVLVNVGDPADEVRAFYAEKAPGIPVLYDTTHATEKAWHVDEVPKACYFTGKGAMVYRGKALWDNVAAAAEESLGLAPKAIQFGVKGTEFG